MKKVLLSVLVAAGLSTTAAHAQGVRLGVKAGASLTSFTGKDVEGLDYKFGFHGGGVAELGLTDNFAIQPEVLFSMKGTKASEMDELRINQSYIDVPVLLKLKADGFFFELGPQVGFLVGSKLKVDEVSVDAKESFKKVDLGYAAGLGYQAASGPMIGLRYNGGISNVGKDSFDIEDGKVRNSAFQLYVGYMFGGK
ncbi:PorT family protein [Hymenobacter aerilatus]|uniref:PorT family protein n=1 Tax=Hymenobacter aerilatus TaxID=2932251 RepID=A0A8T9SX03_9BACT|nr:porin family protein [Hymenobacter aerilatus]UOR04299.1 PorT family protein [Hymenobacter aerilatus]